MSSSLWISPIPLLPGFVVNWLMLVPIKDAPPIKHRVDLGGLGGAKAMSADKKESGVRRRIQNEKPGKEM